MDEETLRKEAKRLTKAIYLYSIGVYLAEHQVDALAESLQGFLAFLLKKTQLTEEELFEAIRTWKMGEL